jgi:hypothetical protein
MRSVDPGSRGGIAESETINDSARQGEVASVPKGGMQNLFEGPQDVAPAKIPRLEVRRRDARARISAEPRCRRRQSVQIGIGVDHRDGKLVSA